MFIKLLLIVLTFHLHAYLPDAEVGEQNDLPNAIEGVGIDEKLNENLPGELVFKNEKGEDVTLSTYYNETKPVILSPVYYSCPSLCNLHLKGVFDVFMQLGLTAGKDFEFVAVSFDPKETPEQAAHKKDVYVSEYLKEQENSAQGIHFLTGTQKNIEALTKAVGFKFKWNDQQNEWAHASAAIISTPQGKISRYMHGVYFDPKTFRLSVVEASEGRVGSIADNFALFCFRYDPKANKYSFYIINILRGLAAIVLLILLAWLVPFWWRSKKASPQT